MTAIRTTLAVLILGTAALAQEGRITLLDGQIHRNAALTSISDTAVAFTDVKGKDRESDAERLVAYARLDDAEPPLDPEPSDVAVLLRGGDVVLGTLSAGPEEKIVLVSPLLGRLSFSVDAVAELRFLSAWVETLEKPTYEEDEQQLDTIVYSHGDRISGTFLESGRSEVYIHGRIGDRHPIGHGNLLAVRFADFPPPPAPKGRIFVLLLGDGSRITATSIRTAREDLVAKTSRGEDLRFPLADLVALHQTGGRFDFLSDRKADKVDIVPWIGDAYPWDRPRYDRSFLDAPLRSGAETFRKGIGVISGTSLTWDVKEEYRFFTSLIALDDAAGAEGDVIFEVLRDGESVFKSKPVRALDPGMSPFRIPPVEIRGAKKITLRVTYLDDFVRDYANWIEPMLIR